VNFIHRLVRTLILPNNAGPNDARIVIGPDIPADLVAFYAGFGFTVVAAIIHWTDGTHYFYEADLKSVGTSNQHAYGWSVAGTIYDVDDEFYNTAIATLPIRNLGNLNGVQTRVGSNNRANVAAEYWQFASSVALDIRGPMTIDTISAPRALRNRVDSTGNTGAIGAETIVLTSGTITFFNGRAYEVKWSSRLTHSAAQIASMRIRQTNLAGASLDYWQFQVTAALSNHYDHRGVIKRTAGTDLIDNLVLTQAASAGTVTGAAAADAPRYLEIWDCGAAADFPNAKTI
jgi:hypothetical protein